MEQSVNKKIYENSLVFKRSLDRIIDKYSKLQHQNGGLEVDLNNTKLDTLGRYINVSVKELSKLQSKNLTHLTEESLYAQDITGDSQLDITYKSVGSDETCNSTNQFAGEDNEPSLSLLNTSLKSFSEGEFQPEDQDEVLQMSLSSNGSSLVELYPGMVSRLERAWHQQHVSVAADSVLRRYRRWRQQSKRRDLNNTFDVTLKHTNGKPKRLTSKGLLKESAIGRIKRQDARTETTPHSALQTATSLHDGQQSNTETHLLRREESTHVRVMDFSDTHALKESLLNETFTVCELSLPKLPHEGEHVSISTTYPSQPHYAAAEASVEPSFILKRLSDPSRLSPRATCSAYEADTPAVKERSDIYESPLRQSPSKWRLMASLSRSPRVFSTRKHSVDRCSEELMRPRSLSSSLSSRPERPVVQLKLLQPQNSIHPSQQQQQLRSPHSAKAADGHHRGRRRHSFDSSLSPNPASYSPKKVDEDFMKLYHKFACQNKPPLFDGPPCRLCARNSDASRGNSSSALVALALSPHRSALRKRHRELEWDSDSESKRLGNKHCTSSPGSKRYRRELLMRRLSLLELKLPHGGLSYSPGKHRVQHPEAWMSQQQPASDAHSSGLGGSYENRGTSSYSPSRQWR